VVLSKFLATSIAKDRPEDASTTHLYVGESHGIASLLDAVDTDGAGRHLLIPRSTARALQPEDLNYLKEKGAFSLPTLQICNALVDSYFRHVHATIPIIDEATFLKAFNEGEFNESICCCSGPCSQQAQVMLRTGSSEILDLSRKCR